MKSQNDLGNIFISGEVFSILSGYVATNCFGVKGMASASVQDGIVQLLRGDKMSKGIKSVYDTKSEKLNVELHIIVEHGVNIPALCSSIMGEVRYTLEKLTGVAVGAVDVCVDSIMADA